MKKEETFALCNNCLKKIPAEIIEKDSSSYLKKFCKEHGEQIELLEEDSDYQDLKEKAPLN